MAKTATRSVELEPIDRLEEKVKLLVAMVDRLKADQGTLDREQRGPPAMALGRQEAVYFKYRQLSELWNSCRQRVDHF
jgi:hypothetical protein